MLVNCIVGYQKGLVYHPIRLSHLSIEVLFGTSSVYVRSIAYGFLGGGSRGRMTLPCGSSYADMKQEYFDRCCEPDSE